MDVCGRPLFYLALAGYDGCTMLIVSHCGLEITWRLSHFSAQHPSQESSLPKLQLSKSGLRAVFRGTFLFMLVLFLCFQSFQFLYWDSETGCEGQYFMLDYKLSSQFLATNLSLTLVLLLIRYRGSSCKSYFVFTV